MNRMEFEKLYRDVADSQERARRGLSEMMVLEPCSMSKLAVYVGIDGRTIQRFLKGEDLRFPQLVKVCKYILDVESRNGIDRYGK